MEREAEIKKQIADSIALKNYLSEEVKTLITIADVITRALRQGNRLFLFGNGGSAADAQHIAGELQGKFNRDREPLSVTCLGTNLASLTAIANDYGYEFVFAREVCSVVKSGDVVIGISTSGQSTNVLRGIEEAKRRGATTVAFCGQGGRLKELADYVLAVPSKDTPRIQEAHITAGHLICYIVEESLFGDKVHAQGGIYR